LISKPFVSKIVAQISQKSKDMPPMLFCGVTVLEKPIPRQALPGHIGEAGLLVLNAGRKWRF